MSAMRACPVAGLPEIPVTEEAKAIQDAYLSQVGKMFEVLIDNMITGTDPECVVKFKLGLLSLVEAKKLALEVISTLEQKGN